MNFLKRMPKFSLGHKKKLRSIKNSKDKPVENLTNQDEISMDNDPVCSSPNEKIIISQNDKKNQRESAMIASSQLSQQLVSKTPTQKQQERLKIKNLKGPELDQQLATTKKTVS